MNYPGHVGVGVLTFGVVTNILNLIETETITNIGIYFAIAMFSASKIIDQDLKFAFFLPKDLKNKRYLYHRQITHSLLLWTIILYLGLFGFNSNLQNILNLNFNINYYIFFFAIGGFSHLIADMLTGSIPIFLWGKYKRGFRIGLNIDITKKLFVMLGDKLSIPISMLGIYLIFSDFKILKIITRFF